MSFSPGVTSQLVSVQTMSDALIEGDELFDGLLTLLPGSERIVLGNDRAMATIQDSSSKLGLTVAIIICVLVNQVVLGNTNG